jgi:hypothetical protein
VVAFVTVTVVVDVKLCEVYVVVAVVERVVVDDMVCIGPGAAAVGAVKVEAKAKAAAKLSKNTKGKIWRDDLLNRTSSLEPSRRASVMMQADRGCLHQSYLRQRKAQ